MGGNLFAAQEFKIMQIMSGGTRRKGGRFFFLLVLRDDGSVVGQIEANNFRLFRERDVGMEQ